MNFVTTFDSAFPVIAKARRKFFNILGDDEECKKVFLERSFRVVYRGGHKNLKELLAPSRIMILTNRQKLRGFNRKGGS